MPKPRPLPEICPFLAAANDPDSVLSYASAENRCQKLGEALPVNLDYQSGYCLRARHWFCPVYTGTVKKPPVPIRFEGPLAADRIAPPTAPKVEPENESAPSAGQSPQSTQNIRRTATVAVAVAVIGAGTLFAWSQSQQNGRNSSTPTAISTDEVTATASATTIPSATATLTVTNTDVPTETETATNTATATLENTSTPALTATVGTATRLAQSSTPPLKACVIPTSWKSYTVAAGETYYKIATRFNTTVDILQKVNCLTDPGRLFAGQTIYVPPQTP